LAREELPDGMTGGRRIARIVHRAGLHRAVGTLT
jgi:hypothetical protein